MGYPMGSLRDDLNERYFRDPRFKALVDSICAQMLQAEITTSEIRDACYMACVKAESLRPFPRFYAPEPPKEGE